MTAHRVAVVGAGRMGSALAYMFARSGSEVRLVDIDANVRARVPSELERIAELLGESAPIVNVLDSIEPAVADVDIVIEAIVENVAVKRSLFEQISACSRDAVIATNTSAISLSALLTSVSRPERFLGAHFWNPPYAVTLVEIVGHPDTGHDAIAKIVDIAAAAGFTPVRVNYDLPGLIGNRLQHALKREAIALVAAGVCDAETVDTVAKMTIGRRLEVLGPLEQSDLVGLDLTVAIHRQLLPDLDRTDHAQDYLEQLVREGHLGMRTGQGFRAWTSDEARAVRDRLDRHLQQSNLRERRNHRAAGTGVSETYALASQDVQGEQHTESLIAGAQITSHAVTGDGH